MSEERLFDALEYQWIHTDMSIEDNSELTAFLRLRLAESEAWRAIAKVFEATRTGTPELVMEIMAQIDRLSSGGSENV